MVDLAPVLDAAAAEVTEVLATSGTLVDLRVPTDPAAAAVDPTTLVSTVTPAVPYATGQAAFLIDQRGGPTDQVPARPGRKPNATVLLMPGLTPANRDEIVVTACRDPQVLGRVYAVVSTGRSSAGVVTVVDAARVS